MCVRTEDSEGVLPIDCTDGAAVRDGSATDELIGRENVIMPEQIWQESFRRL